MTTRPALETNDAASPQAVKEGKYLTFHLAEEEFGIGILKIREIIGMMSFTPIPRTPEFVKGVINLRGKVIPVIDLRLKFGMERINATDETCIIVVDLGVLLIGVFVDRVSEVLDIPDSDIEATPSFGTQVNTEFILGMGKTRGKVVMLLDIAKVLAVDELQYVSSIEG
jgi:purine-binding chemotaxis protein CheW